MPLWVPVVVSASVAIALAILTYLVSGLLGGGKIIGSVQRELTDLSKKTEETAREVSTIRSSMLTEKHIEAAISKLQVEFYKEMTAQFKDFRTTRASDGRAPNS